MDRDAGGIADTIVIEVNGVEHVPTVKGPDPAVWGDAHAPGDD